jgi:hypothetical protein
MRDCRIAPQGWSRHYATSLTVSGTAVFYSTTVHPNTWSNSALQTLKPLHCNLLTHYNCTEWAPPLADDVPVSDTPAKGHDDESARPLSLPPINLLASLRVRQNEDNGEVAACPSLQFKRRVRVTVRSSKFVVCGKDLCFPEINIPPFQTRWRSPAPNPQHALQQFNGSACAPRPPRPSTKGLPTLLLPLQCQVTKYIMQTWTLHENKRVIAEMVNVGLKGQGSEFRDFWQ